MSEIPTVLSPGLGAVVDGLRGLDDDGLLDDLWESERAIRSAQARRAAAVAVVQERIAALAYSVQGVADEVALSLAISPRSADHLLSDAISLVRRPLVWDALSAGWIDLPKVRLIVEMLRTFNEGIPRCDMERDAIAYGRNHTTHQLRQYLLRLTCDGDPGEHLRKKALDDRGVSIFPAAHGMADIAARVSAEHAEIFFQALTKLAQKEDCPDPHEQGDDRTLGQRRADALVGLLETVTKVDVQVNVTISANTLIGEDHRDAYLGRHGVICASVARYLAWSPDARWRRLVCDPLSGALIDVNAESYKIPDRVKRAVRLRDRTCRFPGCHRPAEYTDTDHIVPWSKGGKTRAVDLAGECRRHHLLKTHSAWQVRHQRETPRHTMTWMSPLGQIYTTQAFTYHQRT
ncbi:MAG: DUF222 domain-containing protein [Actinobacteria bacterium]|nr:DUF222 domain-containing protein [Actinomycetota bacterium]